MLRSRDRLKHFGLGIEGLISVSKSNDWTRSQGQNFDFSLDLEAKVSAAADLESKGLVSASRVRSRRRRSGIVRRRCSRGPARGASASRTGRTSWATLPTTPHESPLYVAECTPARSNLQPCRRSIIYTTQAVNIYVNTYVNSK